MKWVKRQFEGDDIEEVNAKILDKIAKGELGSKEIYGEHNDAAVLFCERYFLNLTQNIKMFYQIKEKTQYRARLLRRWRISTTNVTKKELFLSR